MSNTEILAEVYYAARDQYGIDSRAVRREAFDVSKEYSEKGGYEFGAAETLWCDNQIELGFSVFDYITDISSSFPSNPLLWPESAATRKLEEGDLNCLYHNGEIVDLCDTSSVYAVIAKAYRPLIEKTIMPRLREKLIREEPLLQLADSSIQAEQVRDEAAAWALKSSIRRAAQIRYRENPDTARKESPALREFIRGSNRIDENPPLKPAPKEQGMSDELRQRLKDRARFYDELSDQYSQTLSVVCWSVARDGDLTKVLLDNFGDKYNAGEVDIVEVIDMYAASLNPLERRQLCELLAGIAKDVSSSPSMPSMGRGYGSGVLSGNPSHDESNDTRTLLEDANTPNRAHGIRFEGKTEEKEKRPVFTHDGGEIMLGRMVISAIEGYDFGGRIDDDAAESDRVWLQDSNLDGAVIIPGFTSDAKIGEGLFLSPTDRDPYDISGVLVAPERVAILARLYHEGGLPELASQLETISKQPCIRLDAVVDSIQLATAYDEAIGWGTGTLDLTKLQSYGLVRHNTVAGNCSLSAGMLREALEVLGLSNAKVVGGIPLDGTTGSGPLHAQVIFKDERGDAYVADAIGSHLTELQRKQRADRLLAGLALQSTSQGLESQTQRLKPEVAIEQHPNHEALTEILTSAKDQILDLALLLAPPKVKLANERREMQFTALMQLPDEHAAVRMYRGLLDAPHMTLVELLATLNATIDRYDQWITANKQPYIDSTNVLERFRDETTQRQATQTLYGSNIATVYQLSRIVATLRKSVVAATAS